MKKERIKAQPLVSFIIVNYNGRHLLAECFEAVARLDYPKELVEIIMVDNCSDDGSVPFVETTFPQVQVIQNKINNFCAANNAGFRVSRGEFVALLNSDACLDKDWLKELIQVAEQDQSIALLGSKIMLSSGLIQSAGHLSYPNGDWGDRGFQEEDHGQYNRIEEVSSVSHCAALYRKQAVKEVGFLDEDFHMYMEDVDMAFRLRKKGWKVFFVPRAIVVHKLHGSRQDEHEQKFFIERNRLLFLAKHYPEKLKELFFVDEKKLFYTTGEYQILILAVFCKLLKHHGFETALESLSWIQEAGFAKSFYITEGMQYPLQVLLPGQGSEMLRKEKVLFEKEMEIIKLKKERDDLLDLSADKLLERLIMRIFKPGKKKSSPSLVQENERKV